MITNKPVTAPPSVADYFEQKLGAKLPAHPDDDDLDREHPASTAHPDFHIGTGCGRDCKSAIDAAAVLLTHLRATETADESAAIIAAAALLTFVRESIPAEELVRTAVDVLAVARSDAEESEQTVHDIRHITAEVVNCYAYG